jgi:hypothetical protein
VLVQDACCCCCCWVARQEYKTFTQYLLLLLLLQATPLYLSEMAPYNLRGALNILFQLAVTIGEYSGCMRHCRSGVGSCSRNGIGLLCHMMAAVQWLLNPHDGCCSAYLGTLLAVSCLHMFLLL